MASQRLLPFGVLSHYLVVLSHYLVVLSHYLVVLSQYFVVVSNYFVVLSNYFVVLTYFVVLPHYFSHCCCCNTLMQCAVQHFLLTNVSSVVSLAPLLRSLATVANHFIVAFAAHFEVLASIIILKFWQVL